MPILESNLGVLTPPSGLVLVPAPYSTIPLRILACVWRVSSGSFSVAKAIGGVGNVRKRFLARRLTVH